MRFSQLVSEQPRIKEIDINPLLASAGKIVALDARVVLQDEPNENKWPRPVIRPYPAEYVDEWKIDGAAGDDPADPTRGRTVVREIPRRTFGGQRALALFRLDRLSSNALCMSGCGASASTITIARSRSWSSATIPHGGREILAVARLSKEHGVEEAEFALLIGDAWQGKGIGSELTQRLVQIARHEKLRRIFARIPATTSR